MKVLAFNGSPKMERGNTSLILTPFLEGVEEAGAEVELFYTKKLEVNPCLGCHSCQYKTPGKCVQKDDMQMLLPKIREADIWVFATPVHFDGVSGPMKNLMDRMFPLVLPFIELRDGHSRGLMHEGHKYGKVVLVSNCGGWEMDNFDPLLVHMRAFCEDTLMEFAGALLRPHGANLKPMMKMGTPVNDILEAAKDAGRQLVKDGKMSDETLATVGRALLPLETFMKGANKWAHQVLDALEKE